MICDQWMECEANVRYESLCLTNKFASNDRLNYAVKDKRNALIVYVVMCMKYYLRWCDVL